MSNKQINCWVNADTLEEIQRRAKLHNIKNFCLRVFNSE